MATSSVVHRDAQAPVSPQTSDRGELSAAQVYTELASAPDGLSSDIALARSSTHGRNEFVPQRTKRRLLRPLLITVRPLFLPLWIALGLALALGRQYTAFALLAIVVVNTVVAIWQELKTEHAAAKLRDALSPYAHVLRDGAEHNMPSGQIVPGDVLVLQSGDTVPADARVVEAHGLEVTNEVLWGNGQSMTLQPDGEGTQPGPLNALPYVAYAGSKVVAGSGRAVVFATGLKTAYGSLATLTEQAHEEPSPILFVFARIGGMVMLLAAIVTVGGWFGIQAAGIQRQDDIIYVLAALLVAVVPTSLMPGVTIVMYAGLRRLAQHGARVRRLSSVETLGATTVICADKTGTLTANKITVREAWTADGVYTFTGVGYKPEGECVHDATLLPHTAAQQQLGALLRAAVLTATARLLPPDTLRTEWHILGDPQEAAHLVAAKKIGLSPEQIYDEVAQHVLLPATAETPLAGLIITELDQPMALLHGTPEALIERCSQVASSTGPRPLTTADRQAVAQVLQRHQAAGMQTHAFACRVLTVEATHDAPRTGDIARELVLLGLLAVLDPPRTEVQEALETVHKAGIRTMMITAEGLAQATSLACRCGLVHAVQPSTLTGQELALLDDTALRARLAQGNWVLAQLTSEQKVRVIETLDAMGEIVLASGTSANDVPAIKAADIGLAMGHGGSPAVREVADVVLENDNWNALAKAINIGRAVEQQVRRLTAISLGATVLKLTALLLTIALGWPLLLTVGQLLLIDVLASIVPAVAFGVSPVNPRLMRRRPRPSGRPLIDRRVYRLGYGWFALLATLPAVLTVAGALFLNRLAFRSPLAVQLIPWLRRVQDPVHFSSTMSATLFVVVGLAGLLGTGLVLRSGTHLPRRRRLITFIAVLFVLVVLLAVVSVASLQPYLQFTPVPWWGWLTAFLTLFGAALLERARQAFDRTPEK